MTYDQIAQVVQAVTYKEGHTITVRPGETMGGRTVYFLLEARVVDAKTGHGLISVKLERRALCDQFVDLQDVLIFLQQELLLRYESHELREWFRFHGEFVVDPH